MPSAHHTNTTRSSPQLILLLSPVQSMLLLYNDLVAMEKRSLPVRPFTFDLENGKYCDRVTSRCVESSRNFSAIAHTAAQVKISVNDQPIPFNMKIGEAGEAFFVFETDEDVPEDLITSPILLPTKPEEEDLGTQTDATVVHFGMKGNHCPDDVNASEPLPEPLTTEMFGQEAQTHNQEPEFLDLSAGNGKIRSKEEGFRDANLTPKQEFHQPSFLRHSASRSTIRHRPVSESSCPRPGLSAPNSRSHTPEFYELDKRVDEVLRHLNKEVKPPDVEYHHSRDFHTSVGRELTCPLFRCCT